MTSDDNTNQEGVDGAGFSRRGLIQTAAGGLVLAASGLFLPEWPEAIEAAEGAYGGKLGGRHGKDHRGRHRRRTHGDKKDKGGNNDHGPRGSFRGIEWQVNCSEAVGPFLVECWGSGSSRIDFKVGGATVSHDHPATFQTDVRFALLWIDFKYYVAAENPAAGFPRVTLGHGGTYDPTNHWRNGTVVVDAQVVTEDHIAAPMNVDGHHFVVLRETDSDDYKRFRLDIGNIP